MMDPSFQDTKWNREMILGEDGASSVCEQPWSQSCALTKSSFPCTTQFGSDLQDTRNNDTLEKVDSKLTDWTKLSDDCITHTSFLRVFPSSPLPYSHAHSLSHVRPILTASFSLKKLLKAIKNIEKEKRI